MPKYVEWSVNEVLSVYEWREYENKSYTEIKGELYRVYRKSVSIGLLREIYKKMEAVAAVSSFVNWDNIPDEIIRPAQYWMLEKAFPDRLPAIFGYFANLLNENEDIKGLLNP